MRLKLRDVVLVSLLLIFIYFSPCCSVFIVGFERLNASKNYYAEQFIAKIVTGSHLLVKKNTQ